MVAPRSPHGPPTAPPDPPDRPRSGGRWPGPPPERRRRRDLVAAALVTVVAVVGVLVVLRGGDEAATTLTTATGDRASSALGDPVAGPVPTRLVEAWRADSPASLDPVVVGPAVVTAGTTAEGDGVVAGHDPVTGAVAWEYRRPEPPCTVGGGFGDVVALFRTSSPVGTWCSDVAALDPSTGVRGPSRTADVREGTRLVSDADSTVATGADYLEVWRSDFVATLEYGRLPTPVQSDPQARVDCVHGSVASSPGLVAVLERCPGEPTDRLSVLTAAPQDSDRPEDRFSVGSGVTGGRLVAATAERTAVAAPDGTLRTYDAEGRDAGVFALGPLAGPTTDPPGLTAGARRAGPVVLWWTGTGTVGLDAADLRPRWTLPGAIGAGTLLPPDDPTAPATVLVPVPGGTAVVDAATGLVRGRLPVDRAGWSGPVGLAAVGTTVVEQRGPQVVALRP